MARSSECTDQYAQKVFDNADIVRDAIFRQLNKAARARRAVSVSTAGRQTDIWAYTVFHNGGSDRSSGGANRSYASRASNAIRPDSAPCSERGGRAKNTLFLFFPNRDV